jgi:3-hydroxyacyl-CoA dehydrogenase
MQRLKPGVDIVLDILKAVAEAQPHSEFAQSILRQYQERGGLSKKQLQGLYGKAQKLQSIPPGKLATLEAIILKKHTKERSGIPATSPLYQKDSTTGQLIDSILKQFPSHKRVLYLKSKYDNNEVLSSVELSELNRFSKLLK